jgi:endonuclease-3 related protein
MDIVAGAVLVQHTTWINAERALERLRAAGALDPAKLVCMPQDEIASLVRVSGTPSIKARRLRAVAEMIVRAGGIEQLLALPQGELRACLLSTHGIGPETADAITLYAAHQRAFVIDAYTRRVFRRIGLGPERDSYEAWQRWFEGRLPNHEVRDYQRHHAVIVLHAKALCRPVPRCDACPLLGCCDFGAAMASNAAEAGACQASD